MAAIAYPLPRDRAGARQPVRPPEPRRRAGADPIDHRRRRPPIPAARRRATIRRRLTAIAFAAGLVLLVRPLVLPGGDPLVVPGRATPAAAVSTRTYIVQPGDTLWSIARHLHPDQDPRPLVDQLSTQVPGGSLQAGQRLVLP